MRVQRRLIFLGLISFLLLGSAEAFAACDPGEVATPQDVIAKFAGGVVPPGKTACRFSGPYIVVPSIAHSARDDNPPCGKDISVDSSALGVYKPYIDQAGDGLLTSGNPWGAAAGAVLKLVVIVDPKKSLSLTSNCGIASLTAPVRKVVFHCYVDIYNDADPSRHFAVDCNDFTGKNVGNEAYLSVERVNDINDSVNNTTTHGARFKNWATESGNYRHVAFTVDAFE